MKKTFVLFVLVLVGLTGLPVNAEAQYRRNGGGAGGYIADVVSSRGTYGRVSGRQVNRGYGSYWYDPVTIEQMLSLPGGLASCQIDFQTVKVTSCRSIYKSADAIQMYNQNPDGILGELRIEKKSNLLFCPVNDAHPIGTWTGGTLGAGAGGAVGGATGGRRGAVIGAVGGGILGGILGSRRSNNNCLPIEPSAAASLQKPADYQPAVVETTGSRGESTQQQTVKPVTKLVRNNFAYEGQMVRVRDGARIIAELKPGGDEATVSLAPDSNIWFEVFSQNNNAKDRWEWTVIREGQGVYELPGNSGWELSSPGERPTL